MGETKLVRRGEAVPLDPDTGPPAYDAPAATHETAIEPTAHVLARDPNSAESKQSADVGGHEFGATVGDTTSDDTSGEWPKRHADLDELAADAGVEFGADVTTIADKI